MTRIRLAWAAFKNMMRAAAQDPIWAFLALIAMPFRIWKPLLGFLFILIIVTFVSAWVAVISSSKWVSVAARLSTSCQVS